MKYKILLIAMFMIGGCGGSKSKTEGTTAAKAKPAPEEAPPPVEEAEAHNSPPPVEDEKLKMVIDSSERPEEEKERDADRHPYETLTFFGIEPQMTVLELWPGKGWYTHILAPYLKDEGKLIAATTDPKAKHKHQKELAVYFSKHIKEKKASLGEIKTAVLSPPKKIPTMEKNSVDMVVTFRNSHNWYTSEGLDEVMTFTFNVLKPGGILGVVQHRADEGTDPKKTAEKGYLSEKTVIEYAQAAGFVLEEKSEINANPNDSKDYESGVWELPPSLRAKEENKVAREAVGESDRMTLRFKKPMEQETK